MSTFTTNVDVEYNHSVELGDNPDPPKKKKSWYYYFERLIVHSFSIITHTGVNRAILFTGVSFTIWMLTYLLVGEQSATPGGFAFSTGTLIVVSHVVGFVFTKIKVPPLLGMVLTGIFFRNVPKVSIIGQTSADSLISSKLRLMGLCAILVRAGLCIDIAKLHIFKFKLLRLAFLPGIAEAFIFGTVAHFLLKMPFAWSLLNGFIVCNAAPAVIAPLMITLQHQRLGEDKAIPELVMAASCVTASFTITTQSVLIGIISQKSTGAASWWIAVQCLIHVLVGIAYGIVVGLLLHIVRLTKFSIHLPTTRFFLLYMFSMIAFLGSKKISYPSAGPIGTIVLVVIAKAIWQKIDYENLKGTSMDNNQIMDKVSEQQAELTRLFLVTWNTILMPLLFSLLGVEINIDNVNPKAVGLGIATILIGLLARGIVTFLAVIHDDLTLKEKFFVCIAWMPKVAAGSVALETANKLSIHDSRAIQLGTTILNNAVLAIIITAPIGTVILGVAAKMLKKAVDPVPTRLTSACFIQQVMEQSNQREVAFDNETIRF